MFEEFRRIVVFANVGYVYEIETSARIIPFSYLFVVRQPEIIFPSKLVLFSRHVFVTFEESGPENIPCCSW